MALSATRTPLPTPAMLGPVDAGRVDAGPNGQGPVDPALAAAAHLVRRTSLGVDRDRVQQLAEHSWDEAIDRVLADADEAGAAADVAVQQAPFDREDRDRTGRWWLERMTEPATGLRDAMAWFWHGLLTTNADKVDSAPLLARQLDHLRNGALGNYRDLLHGYVTGGALLVYLDADWSLASNPNENLARELMELFTVGRGHYSEDDVRAAARALAGWVVEDDEVSFRRENAFIAPLLFLGQQAEWDTAMVVDRLCDHPATARRVAERLWNHLVGVPLSERAAIELGTWWQDRELAITPLVERILRDPGFAAARMNRARSGLEWYCAAKTAFGFKADLWDLERLEQMPYRPPNVAGWPIGDRWLAPGSLLGRAALVHNLDLGSESDGDSDSNGDSGREREVTDRPAGATTAEILDRCCLFEVSDRTVAVIDGVSRTPDIAPETVELVRWRLALTSPEFQLL